MNADDSAWLEEQFPLLLTACDEALAAGAPAESLDLGNVPAEQRPDIEREVAWYRQVRRMWRGTDSAATASAQDDTSLKRQRRTPPPFAGVSGLCDAPSTSLGRFQIRRELGRGAFGVVFLAHDPVLGRDVALKVPRAEVLVTPELRARFQQEARAAAGLEHPNLVPVYDAGEEGSVCWIASAYCPGITLAACLKQQTEPVPYRTAAQLAAALADGMEHAHQRGVLHRDLKPSNILLSEVSGGVVSGGVVSGTDFDPTHHSPLTTHQPKITDFGLAKLVEGAAEASLAKCETQTGAILGTPGYMAPEQASGQSKGVGPAADIYALGVILYEVLTGRPPFQGDTPLDTLLLVRTQEPLSPSRLRPRLPRDLTTICLKCLQKEPHKRYASALELAEDLRRFLAGEPIRARPTPAWERGFKWAKRRPALAALLAVSGLAAVVVLVVVLLANARLHQEREEARAQRQRAVAHLRKAREAVDQMLTRVGQERLAAVPYMETVRRELLEDARRFYEDLAALADDDPDLRHEMGQAYRRLGTIHGLLGERDKQEQNIRAAVALYEKLGSDFPGVPAYRNELASSYNNLGVLLTGLHRHKEAEQALRQVELLRQKLIADYPEEHQYRFSLEVNRDGLARLFAHAGRPVEAKQAFQESVQGLEKLVAQYPSVNEYRRALANSSMNFGVFLAKNASIPEAEQAFRRDRDLMEEQLGRSPTLPVDRSRVALSNYNLGLLVVENGRPTEGEAMLRRSAELAKGLADEFPKVPSYRTNLPNTLRKLAKLAFDRKDLVQARRLLEEALGHQRILLQTHPGNRDHLIILRHVYSLLTETLIHLGDHTEAGRTAEHLPPIPLPEKFSGYLSAGWFVARCAALVENDQALTAEQRRKLAGGYADRAVSHLRQALERGYKNFNYLRTNEHFEILRLRDDFRKMLEQAAPR